MKDHLYWTINKDLLEPSSHNHVFTYCLWLLPGELIVTETIRLARSESPWWSSG